MIMNKNENFENMIMRNVTKKMINESSYEPLLKKYLIKKSWYGDCTVKQLVDNFNNIASFIRFDLSKADDIKDWTIEFAYFNTTRSFCSRYTNDFEDAYELAKMKVSDYAKLDTRDREAMMNIDTACRTQIRYIVDLISDKYKNNSDKMIEDWLINYIG